MSATCYWVRFSEYAMKVGFLLSRRYAPYHKWIWKEFGKLGSIANEVSPLLQEGFKSSDQKFELAAAIESLYVERLQALGFSAEATSRDGTAYPDNEMLAYAKAVRADISSPEIKNLNLREELVLPATKAAWTWLR